jgi:hypothetical protein
MTIRGRKRGTSVLNHVELGLRTPITLNALTLYLRNFRYIVKIILVEDV